MTDDEVRDLAALAATASEIGARHPEEAPRLLDALADALQQIAVFGDPDAATDMLAKRIDGATWVVRGVTR